MKTALIQVRVDDQVKADADDLFSELGVDTATAVRMFLVQALRVEGLPFDVVRQPRYNAVTEAAMKEADAIADGRAEAPSYGNFADYRAVMGV